MKKKSGAHAKEVPSFKLSEKGVDENYDIAYDFATKAYKAFRELVKSIVLFGSVAKEEAKPGSDIDLIIIVDDCAISWDQELIAWYREELENLLLKQNYKKELHINTVTLSAFWEELKAGEPVVINIIRYGQALIDFGGFFDPIKVLLAKGKIRPTPESVFVTLRRAPAHIARAKVNVLGAVENLYWALVDSAHSSLMAANYIPPSPEHIGEMLSDAFVKTKKLDKKYVDYYNSFYTITHSILHGDRKFIKGAEIDFHIEKVSEFEAKMREITTKLLEGKHIIIVEDRSKQNPFVEQKQELFSKQANKQAKDVFASATTHVSPQAQDVQKSNVMPELKVERKQVVMPSKQEGVQTPQKVYSAAAKPISKKIEKQDIEFPEFKDS